MLAYKRHQFSAEPIKGEHTAAADGSYILTWDNTYSYVTSKTLLYNTQVLPAATETLPSQT